MILSEGRNPEILAMDGICPACGERWTNGLHMFDEMDYCPTCKPDKFKVMSWEEFMDENNNAQR